MNLKNFIRTTIRENLNLKKKKNELDDRIKCIHLTLKQELNNYKKENIDDRWVEIRQEIRRIDAYFEDGYFAANRVDYDRIMKDFLVDLDYSDSYTYKMGEKVGTLPNSDIPVYRALGDKILFRGVSLEDWNRIKKQGYIDSDMRSAIVDTEGINLGQRPSTASYYLPHNDSGVILAISPKNLDLYMLKDEYIRVFSKIPLENVIKVSDTILKNKFGSILTKNTEEKVNDIINELKDINLEINC